MNTDIKNNNFKQTEIGLIPEDWEVVKLGEVVEEIISGDWGEEFKINSDYIETYIIRGTDFKSLVSGKLENIPKRFIKIASLEKRRVLKNDILIELSGGGPDQPTGRICFITSDYNVN